MRLGDLMTKHGSDKDTWHNYCDIYESLIKRPTKLLAMGIGYKSKGGSLKAWADFFPHAEIYGADIDKRLLFETDRIKTFWCDQGDPSSIEKMWDEIGPVDVIIDDGSHLLRHQLIFFKCSFRHCRQYFIEDVLHENRKRLLRLAGGEAFVLDHPTNNLDNNLIYIANESSHLAR